MNRIPWLVFALLFCFAPHGLACSALVGEGRHEVYYLKSQEFKPAFKEEPKKEAPKPVERREGVEVRSEFDINGKISHDPYNKTVVVQPKRYQAVYAYQ